MTDPSAAMRLVVLLLLVVGAPLMCMGWAKQAWPGAGWVCAMALWGAFTLFGIVLFARLRCVFTRLDPPC